MGVMTEKLRGDSATFMECGARPADFFSQSAAGTSHQYLTYLTYSMIRSNPCGYAVHAELCPGIKCCNRRCNRPSCVVVAAFST